MLNDSTKGYGLISIALHWIVAALVVFLYVSGEMFDGLPSRRGGARLARVT